MPFMFCRTVLRVLLTCATIRCFTPATRKRFIIFIMNLAYFSLKARITQSSFHCISFPVVCFKNVIMNIINNLLSNIALSPVAKCEKRKCLPKCQSLYFTKQNALLKQPIRIEYLIKQKPQGMLAWKPECMRRNR